MTDLEDRRHHGTDHDLLVRIDERLTNFRTLVEGLVARMGVVESKIRVLETQEEVQIALHQFIEETAKQARDQRRWMIGLSIATLMSALGVVVSVWKAFS